MEKEVDLEQIYTRKKRVPSTNLSEEAEVARKEKIHGLKYLKK